MSEAEVIIPQEGKKPGTPLQADGVHWYPPGPVSRAHLLSDAFICGIMGPFGSGKSVTCTMKLVKNAQGQPRVPAGPKQGWKLRRTAIIRNTYPELRTTTMNTFFAWVPKHMGHWRDAGPPMLHIEDKKNKLDWEIYFIALDRPDDVAKLLGMELSDAWVNEAREVPKAIIDGLTGRVGRYPAIWQGGCYQAQIIMDTNPPDTDHWWFVLAEGDMSNEKNKQIILSMKEAEENLRTLGFLRQGQRLFEFFRQPSGRSPAAENLRNLSKGYYQFLMAGKTDQFIKIYVDGEYGFVMDGKPVHPEYNDATHSAEFPILKATGFRLAFDFGLTPAATLDQQDGFGRWWVHEEFVSEHMSLVKFSGELKKTLADRYPGIKIVSVRGDPAGDAETPDEKTCFQILRAAGFPTAEKAPTNDPTRRREALAFLLRTLIDGKPAIQIHKRCTMLRKGLSGGFHYRRLQIAGEERYRDVPEKDQYSHVCEALEYDVVSAGEDRNVTVIGGKEAQKHRPVVAEYEYDIFNQGG